MHELNCRWVPVTARRTSNSAPRPPPSLGLHSSQSNAVASLYAFIRYLGEGSQARLREGAQALMTSQELEGNALRRRHFNPLGTADQSWPSEGFLDRISNKTPGRYAPVTLWMRQAAGGRRQVL